MQKSPKLHIVSGKGGVGKTLVASALASNYASAGANTLLVGFNEVATRHPYFAVKPGYKAQPIATGLSILRVDAHLALLEYVRRKMTLSLVYEGILANPLTQKFLDALPLFDELMCLGKLYDLATSDESPYDQIVFDAPATGHCQILLNVPQTAVQTLVAGPIYDSAKKILQMLQDPALSELLIVTLAEETPVREALELRAYAQEAQLACGRVIVNRTLTPSLGERAQQIVTAAATKHSTLQAVAAALQMERDIAALQSQQIDLLRSTGWQVQPLTEQMTAGSGLLDGLAGQLRTEQAD